MEPARIDLARLRQEYSDIGLDETHAEPDPMDQFDRWLAQALESGLHEPNAMVLSTVSASGQPSSRMVLLKGVDAGGFVFFTNQASRKGDELAHNPACALLFGWHPVERQVRITGVAAPLTDAEVEAYFRLRPRAAQIGAWASEQSRPVESRAALEQAYAECDARLKDPVPVPPTWGGYRVRAETVEFWQGRRGRLHDRLLYTRTTSGWDRRRLAP